MSVQTAIIRANEISARYNPTGLIPFPFQNILDDAGNIDILTPDTMPPEVSGAVLFEDERFKILINQLEPEQRRYFTAAHEFGHYFLHESDIMAKKAEGGFVDFTDQLMSASLFRSDANKAQAKELEANNFAAELIMPEDGVRRAWSLTQSIDECAEIFRVSAVAMSIRLQKLGLIV